MSLFNRSESPRHRDDERLHRLIEARVDAEDPRKQVSTAQVGVKSALTTGLKYAAITAGITTVGALGVGLFAANTAVGTVLAVGKGALATKAGVAGALAYIGIDWFKDGTMTTAVVDGALNKGRTVLIDYMQGSAIYIGYAAAAGGGLGALKGALDTPAAVEAEVAKLTHKMNHRKLLVAQAKAEHRREEQQLIQQRAQSERQVAALGLRDEPANLTHEIGSLPSPLVGGGGGGSAGRPRTT